MQPCCRFEVVEDRTFKSMSLCFPWTWFSFLNSKLASDFPTRELLDVSIHLSDTANVEMFADQIPTDSTVRHIWHVSDEAVNMTSLNTFLATTRDSLLSKKNTTCFCLSTWKMHSSKKNGEYWCMRWSTGELVRVLAGFRDTTTFTC